MTSCWFIYWNVSQWTMLQRLWPTSNFDNLSVSSLINLFIIFHKEESSFTPLFLCLVYFQYQMRIIQFFRAAEKSVSLQFLNRFSPDCFKHYSRLTLIFDIRSQETFPRQTISIANNFKVSSKMWKPSPADKWSGDF